MQLLLSFATDTSKGLSATEIENLPAKVSTPPTSSSENVMTENIPIPSTSSVNPESAAAPSFATDTSKKVCLLLGSIICRLKLQKKSLNFYPKVLQLLLPLKLPKWKIQTLVLIVRNSSLKLPLQGVL